MHTDMSILALVGGASFMVQLVLISLLLISIIAWTMIFQKWRAKGMV